MADQPNQLDKFKEAAREALCDEDEVRWEEKLRQVAKAKMPPSDQSSQ